MVDPTRDLETNLAELVLARTGGLRSRLDTFLGHAFERMVEPTYERLRAHRDLPMVRTWSRWDGNGRSGCGIEIDVVAPLASGGVMTGSVKWYRAPRRACDGSADRTRENTFVELVVPSLFDRFLRTRGRSCPAAAQLAGP